MHYQSFTSIAVADHAEPTLTGDEENVCYHDRVVASRGTRERGWCTATIGAPRECLSGIPISSGWVNTDNRFPIEICLTRSTQIPPAPHEIQTLETKPASGEARITYPPTTTIPSSRRQS